MLNIALKMNDSKYINYLCYCLENNLHPGKIESLDAFRNK